MIETDRVYWLVVPEAHGRGGALASLTAFIRAFISFASLIEMAGNLSAAQSSTWVHYGPDGNLAYYADVMGNRIPDYSYAGYMGGGVSLPVVPVKVTLSPVAGDNTTNIQAALNTVGSLTPDSNGFRGAVLLQSGTYSISGTLTVQTSGVVLRGSGTNSETGTVLLVTGSSRNVVNLGGASSTSKVGNTYTVTDAYVPLGAITFHVSNVSTFAVGGTIIVQRPWTQAWIDAIGMSAYWSPNRSLLFERRITAINGNQITVDVPLCNPIEQQWTTGQVYVVSDSGRISQVGIENLCAVGNIADYPANILNGVFANFTNLKNSWMHDVVMQGWGNGVTFGSGVKYCTVQDCKYLLPATGTSSAAPAAYAVSGQLCLMQRCTSDGGYYHIMVTQSSTAGPNVFLNFTSSGTHYNGGPHQRWAAGALHDNIVMAADAADPTYTPYLAINNRGSAGSGQGWAAGFSVMYNCQVPQFYLEQPSIPYHYNWTIGGIGLKRSYSDNGVYDVEGSILTPQSLYLRQLKERLGALAVGNIGYSIFALSGTAAAQAIIPGAAASATVNVTPVNGFTGAVGLAVTGLPSGAAATFSPASITTSGSSTLRVTTSASTPTGTYPVLVTGSNGTWTDNFSFNLLVETRYAAWQSEVFTPTELANPVTSGDTATPAGDGIPNLMKYALNLNPWTCGISGLPIGSITTTGSGKYLTLTYTKVLSATDITYTVQVSTDVQKWNSGPGYTTPPSAINNPDGVTQTVTVQGVAPLDSGIPKQFIRSQVTRP